MRIFGVQNGRIVESSVDIPVPGVGQVLVKNLAIGINRADLLLVSGKYPSDGHPIIPGLEVCGEVVAVGEGVDNNLVNKKICALLPSGGYAQYSVVNHEHIFVKPDNITPCDAASLPEAAATIWLNLAIKSKLQNDETIIIHGASSGIGVMAIQMAKKIFGAKLVIATTSSELKKQKLLSIGADFVINYTQENFVDAVMKITENIGVDVILDIAAGNNFVGNIKLLKYGGRINLIAFLSGSNVNFSAASLIYNNLTIYGSTLRSQQDEVKASIVNSLKKHFVPLVAKGEIISIIDKEFDFSEAEAAHSYMELNQHIGKIILKCK